MLESLLMQMLSGFGLGSCRWVAEICVIARFNGGLCGLHNWCTGGVVVVSCERN